MSSIGSNQPLARTLMRSFGLAPFRDIIPAREFEEVAQQTGSAPKRRRELIPEAIAWLVMLVALHGESMTQGLRIAWGHVRALCPWMDAQCITEEAFCQARVRLTLRFWKTLWSRLNERYEQRFAPRMLWKNLFRVVAVDGSAVNLPNMPALVKFFGRPKNGKGAGRQPQARLVTLCSVFTGYCLAFVCMANRFSEHIGLAHLIRKLRKNDLLLGDRGFFSLRRNLADPATRRSLSVAAFRSGCPVAAAYGAARPPRLVSPLSAHRPLPAQVPRAAPGDCLPTYPVSTLGVPSELAAHLTDGRRSIPCRRAR